MPRRCACSWAGSSGRSRAAPASRFSPPTWRFSVVRRRAPPHQGHPQAYRRTLRDEARVRDPDPLCGPLVAHLGHRRRTTPAATAPRRPRTRSARRHQDQQHEAETRGVRAHATPPFTGRSGLDLRPERDSCRHLCRRPTVEPSSGLLERSRVVYGTAQLSAVSDGQGDRDADRGDGEHDLSHELHVGRRRLLTHREQLV